MSNGEQNPFRLDALDDLGRQLRAREREARERHARSLHPHRPPAGRKRIAARVAVVFTASVALLVGLNLASPAGASSPVSRSPREAEKAGTVRFVSRLEVGIRGLRGERFVEQGALDFRSRAYEANLSLGQHGERVERRLVGGVLYAARLEATDHAESSARWHRLRLVNRASSPSTEPGSNTLIDPQVVLRVLADAPSTPAVVGQELIGAVATTHYRLATSLDSFLEAQHASPDFVGTLQDSPGTLDVWLDQAGRPAQVQASFAGRTHLGTNTMRVVTRFAGYGAPVNIRAPAGPVISSRTDTYRSQLGADPFRAFLRLLFRREE
jgi:hypothetical protein